MIEYVKRRPMSAAITGVMFGRISRRRIALVRSPRAAAASTKPRTDCSSVAVRMMRATSGACTSATPMTSTALARPGAGDQHEQEQEGGEREQHVDAAHQQRVDQRAAVAGDEADRGAQEVREQRGRARELEHAAPAPEHAREDVAAEEVVARAARRRSGPRAGCRSTRRGRGARTTGPTSAISSTSTKRASPTAPLPERAKRSRRVIASVTATSAAAARAAPRAGRRRC